MGLEKKLDNLKGERVVIEDSEGYHYGILDRYDKKKVYLDRYLLSKEQLNLARYMCNSFSMCIGDVSKKGIISVRKIR